MSSIRQSGMTDERSITTRELSTSVNRFCAWLAHSGGASYDPYDVLGTRYGRWARRLYYRKHPLGVVTTAPLILMEVIWPGLRALFVGKDRFPTADAQLSLAFMNLYEARQEQSNGDTSAHSNRDRSPLRKVMGSHYNFNMCLSILDDTTMRSCPVSSSAISIFPSPMSTCVSVPVRMLHKQPKS